MLMDNSNAKIKHANLGNRKKFDEYEEEIPVKGASGEFFVVAGATRGINADSNAEIMRKEGKEGG